MENQFYDNEFERFLQDQTGTHRMYPADAVWKGIYKQLHGHRTWPGLNFFAILVVAALTILTVIADKPAPDQVKKNLAPQKQDIASIYISNQLDPARATAQTFELLQKRREQTNSIVPVTTVNSNTNVPTVAAENNVSSGALNQTVSITTKPQLNSIATATVLGNDVSAEQLGFTLNLPEVTVAVVENETTTTEVSKEESSSGIKQEGPAQEQPQLDPLDKYLQEQSDEIIRLNKKPAPREPRWGLQVYITPSMSFRELINDKSLASSDNNGNLAPVALNVAATDVNEVVKHRPGMGTEFGVAVTYNLTDRLKLKAGGQLNIRQYNIEAYRGTTEQATIALVRGGQVDTFNTYAMYRSKTGYLPTVLTNKYYQLSIPVGVEFSLLSSRVFGLAVGTTLQPTYTITPEASYFITTDYNSYADGTMFLRRWNLNSSFEAILSYNAGSVQWRLSPQVRYQVLSTYSTPYPIREHLIDYGVKIGFAKSL